MAMDLQTAREMSRLVDVDNATVDRRLFYDPEIYQLEMEQIFARAWLFMCHESQIPNPGDFFLNFMGEDRVIVVRNNDGGISALVNSCRHRGNAVCRADEGHATSFMCTYHGWTYDLNGALVGVPGFKEVYHEELDRENWGLIRAPKVESYRGLVFASMDGEAPDLVEYLGSAAVGLDLLVDRHLDMKAVGVEKYTIKCNWKFPSDNTPDWYHAAISHASASMAGPWRSLVETREDRRASTEIRRPGGFRSGFTVLSEYGHGFNGPYVPPQAGQGTGSQMGSANILNEWRERPELQQRLGAWGQRVGGYAQNVFPNLFLSPFTEQVAIRMPKGPMTTELWYFSFVDAKAPAEEQRAHKLNGARTFGASGMLEQEDGENWDQSTRGAMGAVSSRYPLHYAMGKGHGELVRPEEGPERIETLINEHAQLWTYQAWSDFMAAKDWAELKANKAKLEGNR